MTSNDLFERIPQELRLIIVDDLSFEDLLRLRVICKSWYDVFCDTDICAHAIKKYFPLPLEHYFENSGFDCNELKNDDKKKRDWIRKFMINRIRREHGIATQRSQLNYGVDLDMLDLSYSYGRVAVKEENKIIIQNLITKKKFICTTPTPEFSYSRTSEKWKLSEQYLVFSHERSGWEILAWNLSSKRLFRTKLSKKILRLSAYQNQVGVVTLSCHQKTRTYESFIWDIGGALMKLHEIKVDLDSSEDLLMSTNIFFHNVEKDISFLVNIYQIRSSLGSTKVGTKATVHCFKADEIIQTQHEILYTSSKPFTFRSFMTTNDIFIGIEISENPQQSLNQNIYKYITYDMNKKKFDHLEVRLHPTPWRSLFGYKNLIWRDQIYIPVPNKEIQHLQVVTISKSVSDLWDEPWRTAYSPILSSVPSSISRGETRSNSSSVGIEIPGQNLIINSEVQIWGDDSFIIMKNEIGLQFWRFDDLGLTPSYDI
ncbi:putative f-box domain protein [Erysiphe neolycopersici]|uniref:Putative f-box domain protein n=1 Tax=Erysiphe neolycopersici TaxID=212602 RepID=A0A420I4U4_9PEZI|nr:putative f-box domain protein [Erysiphe neolycopersici]